VEKTIDKVQEVGSSFLDTTQHILEVLGNALKPGIELALPIVSQAGEQALKIASPAVSEVSKNVQEVIQSSGFDTQPVLSAAKVSSFLFISFFFLFLFFFSIMVFRFVVIAMSSNYMHTMCFYQSMYCLTLI
jgi:hypothetical protein